MTHPPGQPGGGSGSSGGTTGPGREITTFEFGDLPLRTVTVGGEPWFVVADACQGLDLTNPSMAASRLHADDLSTAEVIDGMGRRQHVRITNESGLYDLIFQSRKPEARAFRRWVTHEVLPAIRATGRYESVPAVPQSYADALQLAADQARQLDAQAAELAEAAPKAQSWDTLASADGDWSVRDAAKILSRDPNLNVGERRLFTVLGEQQWIYRQRGDGRWRPYQRAVESGWLSELPASHYHPRTGELVLDVPQVRVTTRGLHLLHRRLGGVQPLRTHEQTALIA
ncbi:phage antirepressor [Salinispora tropica]|uniref:BRO domain protein domain protein n=1 Tax=Salinispora tropica (strain ATCC BAA-916 / DSM 44818 / JCM 13857 / NBRC 105044 / CNB-440) TaxID=369723 RepID=A4XBY6_SALTO|nr:phage antirepressor KilAC domain-containing protein [Salinispora tropica]ABP56443.1 BRO domain protein domain protein [Salinispora tropica CNB-440]